RRLSVPHRAPGKRQLVFADGEVPVVDDLWSDADAVFELEGDQVRLAVLDLIESGFFPRAALDVGERVVVVDGGNQEWLAARFRVEGIVELEFGRVAGAEMVDLVGGLGLRGVYLLGGLGAEGFEFLLVRLGFACTDVATQPAVDRDTRAFFRLDKE